LSFSIACGDEYRAAEEEQRRLMLAQLLSPAASERLSRIRLVKPTKARQVEEAVIGAARAGRISGPLDEDGLKALLQQFAAVNERKPSITVRGACGGVHAHFWRRACGLVLSEVIDGERLSVGDRAPCDVCEARRHLARRSSTSWSRLSVPSLGSL